MSVQVIFSFDSEDYETPAADDAEKWWAETLARHGVTGCFCVVGELARVLRDRGRQDVLDAWSRHEIAYHSDMHSAHPTHAEYLDTMDWEEGVRTVMERESRGLRDVEEITGQAPSAHCKPGSSWGAQVAYAMPRMGVPVFCDAPFEHAPGEPLYYDNCLFLMYHTHFDGYFRHTGGDRLETMKREFTRLLESRSAGSTVVIYTHPCRLVTSAFPDNFRHGKNPPRSEWLPAPLRPPAEVAELQADFEAFVRWVARDLRPPITTYRELHARHRQPAAPWLSAGAVAALCRGLEERPAPQTVEGHCLSPAEQFSAIVRAAAPRNGSASAAVPVRRLLGPTSAPRRLGAPVELTHAALLEAAARADIEARETGAMPSLVPTPAGEIGPNALLQAVARGLLQAQNGSAVPDRVIVPPVPEEPAIAQRPDIAAMTVGGWSIFPPEFEGQNVLAMARLQLWTAKPA